MQKYNLFQVSLGERMLYYLWIVRFQDIYGRTFSCSGSTEKRPAADTGSLVGNIFSTSIIFSLLRELDSVASVNGHPYRDFWVVELISVFIGTNQCVVHFHFQHIVKRYRKPEFTELIESVYTLSGRKRLYFRHTVSKDRLEIIQGTFFKASRSGQCFDTGIAIILRIKMFNVSCFNILNLAEIHNAILIGFRIYVICVFICIIKTLHFYLSPPGVQPSARSFARYAAGFSAILMSKSSEFSRVSIISEASEDNPPILVFSSSISQSSTS